MDDSSEHLQASEDTLTHRDSFTQSPASWLGGASDKGMRRAHNEDAMSIAAFIGTQNQMRCGVVAVSDGVSSVPGSDISSTVAAEKACTTVMESIQNAPGLTHNELVEVLTLAFELANEQVVANPLPGSYSAGSCTLIVCVVHQNTVTVANIGDSRCYWIGDDGQVDLLSIDDSIAQEWISHGIDRHTAEMSEHAHAITKWLGPESIDWVPVVTYFEPACSGWILVCSDGLWNYASEPVDLQKIFCLAVEATWDSGPTKLAEWLTAWANSQGGHDNVTVALCRFEISN